MEEEIEFENGPKWSNFLYSWAPDLDLDLGSGHGHYLFSSLIEYYLYTKFHRNRRNFLWTDGNLPPIMVLGRLPKFGSRPNDQKCLAALVMVSVCVAFAAVEGAVSVWLSWYQDAGHAARCYCRQSTQDVSWCLCCLTYITACVVELVSLPHYNWWTDCCVLAVRPDCRLSSLPLLAYNLVFVSSNETWTHFCVKMSTV